MFNYDTVTEAVQDLRQRGYTIDFNLEADRICCQVDASGVTAEGQSSDGLPGTGNISDSTSSGKQMTPLALAPSEFEITEVYRFEGNSDPADEAIVFAIESKKGEKGVLVNGFGISADKMGTEMIKKLSVHH